MQLPAPCAFLPVLDEVAFVWWTVNPETHAVLGRMGGIFYPLKFNGSSMLISDFVSDDYWFGLLGTTVPLLCVLPQDSSFACNYPTNVLETGVVAPGVLLGSKFVTQPYRMQILQCQNLAR